MSGSFYGISVLDNSKETGRTDFTIGDLTSVSLPGALTQMGALRTAIEGVILGVVSQSRWGDADFISRTPPSNVSAQRGIKWTLLLEDNTTHNVTKQLLPTADLTLLDPGEEDLDLTADEGLALKTAVEALVKSPAGNAVTLLRCYYSD